MPACVTTSHLFNVSDKEFIQLIILISFGQKIYLLPDCHPTKLENLSQTNLCLKKICMWHSPSPEPLSTLLHEYKAYTRALPGLSSQSQVFGLDLMHVRRYTALWWALFSLVATDILWICFTSFNRLCGLEIANLATESHLKHEPLQCYPRTEPFLLSWTNIVLTRASNILLWADTTDA